MASFKVLLCRIIENNIVGSILAIVCVCLRLDSLFGASYLNFKTKMAT